LADAPRRVRWSVGGASRREGREPVIDAVIREASLLEQARGLYQDLRTHAVIAEGG